MATNKNAQLRYHVLDKCFSNPYRRFSIEDLINAVNEKLMDINGTQVSLRQIRADIKFMRDSCGYDAPIETYLLEGKKQYYKYLDPDFRIFGKEISEEALEAVRKTVGLLNQYRELPQNGWMEEIISTLEVNLGLRPDVSQFVSIEKNERLKGLHFLSEIIDHTINKQVLKVAYKPYRGDEREITLHPYHIRQYNNRWFLFGWDEEIGKITNLALDRINGVKRENSVIFNERQRVDFTYYFDDIVGVSIPSSEKEPENIIIKFSTERLPYILTKPIHSSQRQIESKKDCIEIFVIPTRELDSLILSYGADAKVISPKWYREKIMKIVEKNLKGYLSDNKE